MPGAPPGGIGLGGLIHRASTPTWKSTFLREQTPREEQGQLLRPHKRMGFMLLAQTSKRCTSWQSKHAQNCFLTASDSRPWSDRIAELSSLYIRRFATNLTSCSDVRE